MTRNETNEYCLRAKWHDWKSGGLRIASFDCDPTKFSVICQEYNIETVSCAGKQPRKRQVFGSKGPKNPEGASEQAGSKGQNKQNGPNGANGQNGAGGSSGSGQNGSKNPSESSGSSGPSGTTASYGPYGPNGPDGSKNPSGSKGSSGTTASWETASYGPNGPNGPNGPHGSGNGPKNENPFTKRNSLDLLLDPDLKDENQREINLLKAKYKKLFEKVSMIYLASYYLVFSFPYSFILFAKCQKPILKPEITIFLSIYTFLLFK